MTTAYEEEDKIHFGKQLKKVYDVMKDKQFHTPYEIEEITGINCSSITSRLRELRQAKFGGFIIERQRKAKHTHQYRLSVPVIKQMDLFPDDCTQYIIPKIKINPKCKELKNMRR